MERLTRFFDYLRSSVSSLSRPMRLAAAVLLTLTVAGVAWLALADGSDMVTALDAPASADELATIRQHLDRMGIAHRVQAGRLLVAPQWRRSVRNVLTELQSGGADAMSSLRKAASAEDMWQSQAAAERRWQVAKMDLLNHMIRELPQVQSASVVIDGRSSRKLGAPRAQTAAIVKVTLSDRAQMTRHLTAAIADIVAGSVAGMKRQDVRIVDQSGRSYRATDYGQASAPAERLMAAEQYHADRIRSALAFMGPVAVTVQVASGAASNTLSPCVGADVSISREHLDAAVSDGGTIDTELAVIKRRVMRAAGISDARAVTIELHRGAPQAFFSSSSSAAAISPAAAGGWTWLTLVLCVTLCVCVVGAGVGWMVYRRSGACVAAGGVQEVPASQATASDETFVFLGGLSGVELLELLRREHPQTVAIVLSRVGPGKGAVVLAGLEPQLQVEVIRRIASLSPGDNAVAREISAALAEKYANAEDAGTSDGVAVAAEILNHAEGAAERTVMEGLSGQAPELMGSIREQMFEFDDIAAIPAGSLRGALEREDIDEIAVALRAAGSDVSDSILSALAPGVATQVRMEMEQIGPVRLSDVEAAQQRLASHVRSVQLLSYVSDTREHDEQLVAERGTVI